MKASGIGRSTAGALLILTTYVEAAVPQVNVFKKPDVQLFAQNGWNHLKANGFTVKGTEVDSTAGYRRQYGVPQKLQSCHTAGSRDMSSKGTSVPPTSSAC